MRLIKTSSLDRPEGLVFEQFHSGRLPSYAILSHTWGDDEVTWDDFQKGTATQKPRFRKIRHSCLQATSEGFEWIWIDSACIDKSSSAELSEAINSMYQWYQQAEICYAYLEGVSATVDATLSTGEFAKCKWFTRGWTLQELLAPRDVIFYSEDWCKIGTKAELCDNLSVITGIDQDILVGTKPLNSASVAKRMSWAAYRETTRVEDIAYCLMGIFDVNMPMLYGEGSKAFLRLQEEIMKQSDDQSIFAWVNLEVPPDTLHGLLADSPRDFAHSNTIFPYPDWELRPPYQLTQRGLRIELPMVPHDDGSEIVYIAAIDCPSPPDYEDWSFLALYLKKNPYESHQYSRVRLGQLGKVRVRGQRQEIYVKQNVSAFSSLSLFPHHVFQLRRGPSVKEYKISVLYRDPKRKGGPPDMMQSSKADVRAWLHHPYTATFTAPKTAGGFVCGLVFERVADNERIVVLLGTMDEMRVGYCAIELPPESDDDTKLTFAVLQNRFRPGEVSELRYNNLTVDSEMAIFNGSKYYLIDIGLRATGTRNLLDIIMGGRDESHRDGTGTGKKQEKNAPRIRKFLSRSRLR
ncbi:heterokaryon incompatibility protein-domain-containing protein [Stachybotrys elegans]|uniref:Heterokaryon incompatibility protein-domain-containing protein n=1 Tax=Stachybotrys elegans TaxID=80388 RepID=A0A8K0WTR6_9HYPO|nr:heterokaryon incompatibility protein-domain-containing protein [Stachybotrys elegans]